MKGEEVKEIVKETYGNIASQGCDCGCGLDPSLTTGEISTQIGYSEEDVNAVPEANLGLGCGNPTALGKINVTIQPSLRLDTVGENKIICVYDNTFFNF